MIDAALRGLLKTALRLRYRVRTPGLDDAARRGTSGILFLPNHPALIDPVILMTHLHKRFAPKALADENQIDRFFIRRLARRAGVRPIPDLARDASDAARRRIRRQVDACAELLREGENVLLYPSGHLLRQKFEEVGGNSAVERILKDVPDCRVVLVRTRGLWGSRFSWASGREPRVGRVLAHGLPRMLASGVVFTPKRRVDIEFFEPGNVPREAGRSELNAWLEGFYNAEPTPNTYVPMSIWEKAGARTMPEPPTRPAAEKLNAVGEETRCIVTDFLKNLAEVDAVRDEQLLARDLGMDSLARSELLLFLDKEFGHPQADVDAIRTVADVLLVASGQRLTAVPTELKPVPGKWFAEPKRTERVRRPRAETLGEAFLAVARGEPDRAILADQNSGVRTYRDVVTAAGVLSPRIAAMDGDGVGIMLPASVGAAVLYMAAVFSGKAPVMINWTVGPRNIASGLKLTGVRHILTSRLLTERLRGQGVEFGDAAESFAFLEDIRAGVSKAAKLKAWLKARGDWGELRDARPADTAAVLFTSGSEATPKAVPLTHANILANLRDLAEVIEIHPADRLMGILPAFHSFGLTVGIGAALCLGIPTAYHPNPSDGPGIAAAVEAYKPTLLVGTPTFLSGIVRGSTEGQLECLRLIITGAEKCPPRVYRMLGEACGAATVLEGYGVTECSPVVAVNRPQAPRPGTIGRLLPSFERALLHPETNEPVGAGEDGVLLLRGPCVFDGYLGEAKDPFVEHEGRRWHRTGDLVREDADGVLTFRGRLKRFVKIGGEMISLPAIEAVLAERFGQDADDKPALAVEAADDEPRPDLVLFTTRPIERQQANDCIREAGLSPLHHIRRVRPLDELPLLGTGKTDYKKLKEMLRSQ